MPTSGYMIELQRLDLSSCQKRLKSGQSVRKNCFQILDNRQDSTAIPERRETNEMSQQ